MHRKYISDPDAPRRFFTAFLLALAIICMALAIGVAFFNTYQMMQGQLRLPKLPLERWVHRGGELGYRLLPSEVKVLCQLASSWLAALF